MRRFAYFASASLLVLGSALGIGCGKEDSPTIPDTALERVVVSSGDGVTRPSELPVQCSVTPLSSLAANQVMVVDLVEGLSTSLSRRSDEQRSAFGTAERDLAVASRALRNEDAALAVERIGAVIVQFSKLANEPVESVDAVWASAVVARLQLLLDRSGDALVSGFIDYEQFNQVARDVSGSEGFLARGSCFQDCLKAEIEECAESLIENIGGPTADGIIENIIDNCITGALAGCIATGPGCLIGALEGCLLAISVDFIWQVSKFLCCVGASFASCAWDCWW